MWPCRVVLLGGAAMDRLGSPQFTHVAELGRVGLNETEAKAREIRYMKMLIDEESGRILGFSSHRS
jgi:hypothetical protein